jgi:hypothetical protein
VARKLYDQNVQLRNHIAGEEEYINDIVRAFTNVAQEPDQAKRLALLARLLAEFLPDSTPPAEPADDGAPPAGDEQINETVRADR